MCKIYLLTVKIIAMVFCSFLAVLAQDSVAGNEDVVLPPNQEEFEKGTDLVAPWRNTSCFNIKKPDRTHLDLPKCNEITGDDPFNSHILTIYNDDATIWHRFSLGWFGEPMPRNSPELFRKNTNEEFVPFAKANTSTHPFPILRIVKESPHWYEVEINEKTRKTKFILKNDKLWEKTRWDFWLYVGYNIYLDKRHIVLYDKPNGKVIKETQDIIKRRVKFIKTDGDWAYVRARNKYTMQIYKGWVRWRKGREILVGNPAYNRKLTPQKNYQ